MPIVEETFRLFEYLPPPKSFQDAPKVLDIGCGDGEVALYLAEKGYNVTAIDTESNLINIIKKNHLTEGHLDTEFDVGDNTKVRVLESSFEEFHTEETFDIICNFGVLHYYPSEIEVSKCIQKMEVILKAGGILLLSWITGDSLNRESAYFPPLEKVFQNFLEATWKPIGHWEKELTHSHGDLPVHTHEIVYSAWKKLV